MPRRLLGESYREFDGAATVEQWRLRVISGIFSVYFGLDLRNKRLLSRRGRKKRFIKKFLYDFFSDVD
jgi:hypothetical protein